MVNKATRILANDTHMLHGEYILLPSSRRFRTVTCKTNRKRLSFISMSIRLLNDKSLGHFLKIWFYVILYVSFQCDAMTIIRISFVVREFRCFPFLSRLYFINIFIIYKRCHKFPVYGSIKDCCIVLYCIVLYCIASHRIASHRIASHRIALYYAALCYVCDALCRMKWRTWNRRWRHR